MLKYFMGILAKEIVEVIAKVISDYLKLRQKKKEDKVKVNEALKVKNPADRARAVRNLLQ
jgi:isochorismate hydrolase